MKQKYYKIIIYILIGIIIFVSIYKLYVINNLKKQITLQYKNKIDSLYIHINDITNQITTAKEQVPIIVHKKTQITYKINQQYNQIENIDSKIDSIKLQLLKINQKE